MTEALSNFEWFVGVLAALGFGCLVAGAIYFVVTRLPGLRRWLRRF